MKKSTTGKKLGSALILTTILLFVILSIVVTLSYVTVMEQKMSQKTKSSVGAFYNSESGIEWALNKIANSNGSLAGSGLTQNPDFSINCPVSVCTDSKVFFLKSDGTLINSSDFSSLTFNDIKAVRSVGTQNTGEVTQRAIEAAVASTLTPYALFYDQKADSAGGGASTTGTWQTRDLNTVANNDNNIVSLSSNQFTLQAGTYYISAKAPGYAINGHRARIQNITDGTTILLGPTGYDLGTSGVMEPALVFGKFTIGSAKTFALQEAFQTARATTGLGIDDNIAGTVEIFSSVELWKLQ